MLIPEIVAKIRTAVYGRDVRESIALGIELMDDNIFNFNSDLDNRIDTLTENINISITATNKRITDREAAIIDNINAKDDNIKDSVTVLSNKQVTLENTFTDLVINAGNSNAEIVAARTSNVTGITADTIGHRIDAIESKSALSITDFGAVGDALYYNSATNKYYSDEGFTKLATPFSDIFNSALLTAQLSGMDLYIPSGTYLIDKQMTLRSNVNIIGDFGKTTLLLSDTFVRYDDYVFKNESLASLTKKDNLSFDGISIIYEGHVAPTFSDIAIHGVLFKLKNLSSFVFARSSIKILNKGAKPLVTGLWFRGNCSNVEVYNSYIENTGCANEGGNIWISTNENDSDINDGINIHNNTIIKHSGDELLAIWGIGTNKNINFYNNKLVYESNVADIICAKLITVFTYSIGLFENIYIKDNSIELKGKVSIVFNSGIKAGTFNNVMYDKNVINDYVGDTIDLISVCKIEPIDIVSPETTYEEAYARANIIYSNNTYTNNTSIGRRTFASVTSSIIKLYNNIVNSKFSYAVIFEESGNSKILSSGNHYNYDAISKYASIFSEIRGQDTKAYFAKDYIKFASHLYLKLGGSSSATNTLVEFNSCNVRGSFALMSIQQAGSIDAVTNFINNTFEAATTNLYYGDNQYLTKLGTLNFINNTLVNATPLTTVGSENVTSLVKANSTINISGNKWGNNATDYSSATAPTNVGIYKIFPEGKKILNIGVGSHVGWVKKSDDSWLAYYGLDGGEGTPIPTTIGLTTITMDSALKSLTPTGNCILNATIGTPGQTCKVAITTSGTTTYTITWGNNFKTTPVLETGTVEGKIFIVSFICINYIWVEIGRTLAI